jgi:potassium efflux system protein
MLFLGISFFAYLQWRSRSLHLALRRCGRRVGGLRHDRFYYSLKALVLTLVLALPWPVLFATLGLHLQLPQGIESIDLQTHLYQVADWNGQFVPSIGAAFYDIAFYSFYFIAFRLFCLPQGLAVAHFNWSLAATSLLRQEILILMIVFLPVVFVLSATITYDPAALASGLSRLLLCVIVVSSARCIGRILSPVSGALREFYRDNPGNPLTWLRYLWFGLGLLLPAILAVLTITGYVYTATQLGARLIDTLWLIVAIVLIHQLVVRWVELLERRLQFRNALERRRAQRAARDAQEGEVAPTDSIEEDEIDFVALSENTLKLINSAIIVITALGMWATWSGVLPAFRILDEVSLWSYHSEVDGVMQSIPVTLGDLTTGFLIIVLGAIMALRLPALMEILLFARFNITAGSRYAISKLTQYTIIAVALVMVFSVLGAQWGEIQWLVAALGVGIGFGLQEIIANFISGLILLFERPIRIGDIVTVGDTSGVVTRIRIRSTTIRNWDQQELLVPNKEFITGRLLNWTLSDPVARIVIDVGIAYGSDVTEALRIVLASAEQHERVLDEPKSLVTFETFGDNALGLKLRCYIGSMDYRLQTMSEINETINRDLAAAGIVIAFPQRDIHLDTSKPLDVHLHRIPADKPQS